MVKPSQTRILMKRYIVEILLGMGNQQGRTAKQQNEEFGLD